jgi:hypothetical protein
MWFVERVGMTPDLAGQWLPGMVLLGIGAGTLFPNLSGAAVASAPGQSFATVTGANSVARQTGAALGVAVVVAIIGTPTPATAHTAFQHAWTFGAVCLFVAVLGCLLLGHVSAGHVPAAADAGRAVSAVTEPRDPMPSTRPRPGRMTVPDTAAPADPLRNRPPSSWLGPRCSPVSTRSSSSSTRLNHAHAFWPRESGCSASVTPGRDVPRPRGQARDRRRGRRYRDQRAHPRGYGW